MDPTDSPPGASDPLVLLLQQLSEFQSAMPCHRLQTAERRELGGHLFAGAPRLVTAVAEALTRSSDLFPDLPVDGETLMAQQRLASRWIFLRDALATLAQLAGDSYLKIQGEAIKQAIAVLRTAEERPAPGEGADSARRRSLELVPASFILHTHREAMEQRKAQNRKRAAPGDGPKERSSAQVRAARAAREQRQSAFRVTFHSFLEQELLP